LFSPQQGEVAARYDRGEMAVRDWLRRPRV